MKIKFKLSIEIRRGQPCQRRHADDPPEQLASCSDAHVDIAPEWYDEARAAVVAHGFGFRPARRAGAGPAAPAPPTGQQQGTPGHA